MNLGWIAGGILALSATPAVIQKDSERMIDAYISVCTKGIGKFDTNAIKPIKFRQMPYSFQRYFNSVDNGQYFAFTSALKGYLISYRLPAKRSGGFIAICAVAIEGMSIDAGRSSVLEKLNINSVGKEPNRNHEVIDIDQNGNGEIRYLYLRNMNFATNSSVGPRFLVIQSSVYN